MASIGTLHEFLVMFETGWESVDWLEKLACCWLPESIKNLCLKTDLVSLQNFPNFLFLFGTIQHVSHRNIYEQESVKALKVIFIVIIQKISKVMFSCVL
jgi:hypothetical protein